MTKQNIVFIAKSIDGFIADKNGGLDWLESIPNPDGIDMGFISLMESIDAVVMGRTTFDKVCSFDIDWPYQKHVFVLSSSMTAVPDGLEGKVSLLSGSPKEILNSIHAKGFGKLYIDGGRTVQDFLKDDLVDDLIITTIPVVLGSGFPLFSNLDKPMYFQHVASKQFLSAIVQDHYRRKR